MVQRGSKAVKQKELVMRLELCIVRAPGARLLVSVLLDTGLSCRVYLSEAGDVVEED